MKTVRRVLGCALFVALILALSAGSALAMEADDSLDTCPELVVNANTGIRAGYFTPGTGDHDVVAVLLFAGEDITVSLESETPGTDFGLKLLDPWALDLTETPLAETLPAHLGGPGANPTQLVWHIRDTGYYFVDAYTWVDGGANGGSGNYTLTVDVRREATWATISPPKTFEYNAQPWIEGEVLSERGSVVMGTAVLYFSNDGLNWIPLEETTLSGGRYEFPGWISTRKTWYMVIFEGNPRFCSASASTYFNSKAAISSVTASRYGTQRYRLTGRLRPAHKAGTYPVRIYLWRKVNGSYKSYGYVKAVASTVDDYSKYSYSKYFPAKGTWRMRAYHSCSIHAGSWSSYTYKSVY